jgi:hypothetical protein
MAHRWDAVNNIPSGITPDTMVLLSDGDVLVLDSAKGFGGKDWYRLHPNDQDDYANGTWSGPFTMANTRQFFASGVLRDGRFFAIGGEVSDDVADTPKGEIFDPVANTWSAIVKPSTFDFISGDIAACILADGRVILGALRSSRTALWDPVTDDWREAGLGFGAAGTPPKQGGTNEETWTLLPDGTVLTVNINGTSRAEKYVPSTDSWVPASAPPQVLALMSLNDTTVNPPPVVTISEIGPAVVLPDGHLFAVGATGHTAIYAPPANPSDAGTWTAGPDFPTDTSANNFNSPNNNLQTAIDAPAVLLPSGKVLCVAGNTVREVNNGQTQFWSNPLRVYVFDPGANTLTLLSPQAANASVDTWEGRFLLLPNGRVLLSTEHSGIQQLTVDAALLGSPDAGSKPAIVGFPSVLIPRHTYTISGTQFNGKSQACSYGDDAQMATNYPIVRLTRISDNTVRYLRSFNFSTMGIATGTATVTAAIAVPEDVSTGQYNMQVIANGIESDPVAIQVASQDCFFIVDRSTYGQGEIQALINLDGTPATIDPAFYVVVEGFRPSELGITAANLASPPNLPNVPSPATGITINFSGPLIPEDPSLPDHPQRFTFPFSVSFANADSTPGGIFDFTDPNLTLNATLTAAGNAVTSSAQIQLIKNPNPIILHGDTAHGKPWYLSIDIRVFQIKEGKTKFAAKVGSGPAQTVATTFIQQVITNLNNSPAADSLFNDEKELPPEEDASALALSPVDVSNVPVYNFALARVRLRDISTATNVRLFFRMWPAQQTNATYDTSTLYRSIAISGGNRIPLLGVVGDEIMTIPFFATTRIVSSSVSMTTQQPDTPNIHTLNPDPLGGEMTAFYGCWLDINQPNDLLFPARMVGGNPANIPDGPFTGMGPLLPIQQLVRSEHQCLLAEISFDPDPIPPSADPSNSDKLAQRNLAFVNVPNPGVDPSRVAPQPFEVRPSPAVLLSDNRPDELMVLWGNTPSGTLANFYLPNANAAEMLHWADRLYATHRITMLDAHTVQVPAAGVTYLPVPQGSTVNFAGLLSLGLPGGVRKGDQYKVAVRQITSAASAPVIEIEARAAARAAQEFTWRRSLGAFQLNIPVETKQTLLEGESRRLSVMRWIQSAIPHDSRWFPVSQRYLDQLAGRVHGMGGDPSKVKPSPTGDWYRAPDGRGSLVVTFADKHGNPLDEMVDVFLKHNVLSDTRTIRNWSTLDTLVVRDLISTNSGIYELQAIGDRKLAGGQFVTIEDGRTTVVQLKLERK